MYRDSWVVSKTKDYIRSITLRLNLGAMLGSQASVDIARP